jgi:hypothetical protein
MGTAMADVPVFGTNFNTWFPLVVVVYCSLLCALPAALWPLPAQ